MRSVIGYVLLGIICFTEMTTVMPWLEYVWNYDYISQVLCINKEEVERSCNGKCFLMTRLAQAEEEKSSPVKRVPTVDLEKTPFILNSSGYYPVNIAPYKRTNFPEIEMNYLENTLLPSTPPPKV